MCVCDNWIYLIYVTAPASGLTGHHAAWFQGGNALNSLLRVCQTQQDCSTHLEDPSTAHRTAAALPGAPTKPQTKSWPVLLCRYIPLPDSAKKMFYYLVSSEGTPDLDPVILWLSGGPGCSAMDAFIYEHGPFKFHYSGVCESPAGLHAIPARVQAFRCRGA